MIQYYILVSFQSLHTQEEIKARAAHKCRRFLDLWGDFQFEHITLNKFLRYGCHFSAAMK